MATSVGSADASSLAGIASQPSEHTTTVAGGAEFPPDFPPAFAQLPTAEEAAVGAIGDPSFGGPSGGNNPAQPGAMTMP